MKQPINRLVIGKLPFTKSLLLLYILLATGIKTKSAATRIGSSTYSQISSNLPLFKLSNGKSMTEVTSNPIFD